MLGLAQQMADRLTGQAEAEAAAMLSQARAKADQLLSDAKAKAEDLVQEARTRVEALLTDARAKAETLARQSHEETALLEQETARQHSETIAVLNREKTALEDKIDRLRALERDYRIRLKSYFTAQLRELDGDETSPPSAPLPNLQSLPTFGPSAHAQTGSP
jgi:vacuolar-type H+-ATPase subunit H